MLLLMLFPMSLFSSTFLSFPLSIYNRKKNFFELGFHKFNYSHEKIIRVFENSLHIADIIVKKLYKLPDKDFVFVTLFAGN